MGRKQNNEQIPLFENSNQEVLKELPPGCQGFSLCDNKVLLWNKGQVFYLELNKLNESGQKFLEEAKIKLNTHTQEKEDGLHKVETNIVEITSRTDTNPLTDIINIKIAVNSEQSEMISFDLITQRQVSRVSGTTQAEFIYDNLENCYVLD